MYSWYTNELDRLKQRLNGARTTDQDRGSRIMAYYRMLKEYQNLAGVWAVRISTAQLDINMATYQQKLQKAVSPVSTWTTGTDVQIANKVFKKVNFKFK